MRFIKTLFLFISLTSFLRAEVPAEVLRNAGQATQALGDKVRIGDMQVSIDRMYPRWKAQMSKRVGGTVQLAEMLKKSAEQMRVAGVTIESFIAEPPVIAYEASLPKGAGAINGETGEQVGEKLDWLVLVPTRMIIRMPDPDTGVSRKFETKSYQIAISSKAKLDWTFIDGSSVKIQDLRSLFPTLPETLQLPVTGHSEIKK